MQYTVVVSQASNVINSYLFGDCLMKRTCFCLHFFSVIHPWRVNNFFKKVVFFCIHVFVYANVIKIHQLHSTNTHSCNLSETCFCVFLPFVLDVYLAY